MAKRLLIILPIVYIFYAVLTLDNASGAGDGELRAEATALIGEVMAELDSVPDAEALTIKAERERWEALAYYPATIAYRFTTLRMSRNLQFWGGIFFAAAVFAIGITQRAWTGKAPPG
jgi:hypothetical protein